MAKSALHPAWRRQAILQGLPVPGYPGGGTSPTTYAATAYGVVADGSTDNATALQSLQNAVSQ